MTTRADIDARTTWYRNREEWLASRRYFCGVSEAAEALGLSDFADASPCRVWLRHVMPDAVPPMEGERLDWGNWLEAAIVERFQHEHPHLWVEPRELAVTSHPTESWLRMTPDALVWPWSMELDSIVDAKNTHHGKRWRGPGPWAYPRSAGTFGEPGTDQVPRDYLVQGLLACEVFDVPVCWFSVLFGGNEWHLYRVERRETLAAQLVARLRAFMTDHVWARVQPPVDGSEAARRMVAAAHPRDELPALEPSDEARALARRVLEAARAAKDGDRANNRLRELCGAHEGIDGVCTYRTNRAGQRRLRVTYQED